MNRRTEILFYVGMGLLLTFFIGYLVFTINSNKSKKVKEIVPKNVQAFSRDSAHLYNNKLQAYNDLNDEKHKESVQSEVNVNLSEVFDTKKIKVDSTKFTQVSNQIQNNASRNVPQNGSNNGNVVRRVRFNNTPSTINQQGATTTTTTSTQATSQNQIVDNFGIYTAQNQQQSNNPTQAQPKKESFVQAYFKEDTKIMDNSAIVLILKTDAVINGTTFFKNSVLYGYAKDAGKYFDLQMTSITNTDGVSYHLDNVNVYNESYTKGIVYESNINKAVKESGNATANDAANTGSGVIASSIYGQMLSNATQNTVRAVTANRHPSVTISHGYRVFIKSE